MTVAVWSFAMGASMVGCDYFNSIYHHRTVAVFDSGDLRVEVLTDVETVGLTYYVRAFRSGREILPKTAFDHRGREDPPPTFQIVSSSSQDCWGLVKAIAPDKLVLTWHDGTGVWHTEAMHPDDEPPRQAGEAARQCLQADLGQVLELSH